MVLLLSVVCNGFVVCVFHGRFSGWCVVVCACLLVCIFGFDGLVWWVALVGGFGDLSQMLFVSLLCWLHNAILLVSVVGVLVELWWVFGLCCGCLDFVVVTIIVLCSFCFSFLMQLVRVCLWVIRFLLSEAVLVQFVGH